MKSSMCREKEWYVTEMGVVIRITYNENQAESGTRVTYNESRGGDGECG